ncbi:FatB protein [Tanacetum coccineum]
MSVCRGSLLVCLLRDERQSFNGNGVASTFSRAATIEHVGSSHAESHNKWESFNFYFQLFIILLECSVADVWHSEDKCKFAPDLIMLDAYETVESWMTRKDFNPRKLIHAMMSYSSEPHATIKSKSTSSGGMQIKTNAQAPTKVNSTRVGVLDGLKTDDNSSSAAPRTFINQFPDWSMLLAAITTIFLAILRVEYGGSDLALK